MGQAVVQLELQEFSMEVLEDFGRGRRVVRCWLGSLVGEDLDSKYDGITIS